MVNTLKTRDTSALKEKLKKQAGFTLAELLIVVAIMAILAAIAVPMYLGQMDAAARRVDESTLSAATTMAASDYLLNNRAGDVSYSVFQTTATAGGSRNISIGAGAEIPTDGAGTALATYDYQSDYTTMTITIGTGGQILASTIS